MSARPAVHADAANMAVWHALAFDRPWTERELLNFMATGAKAAVEAGGFILWRTTAGEAEILTLAVDPAARRQGLGAALLDFAMADAATSAKTLFLEVADDNDAAIALYQSRGFEPAGRRTGYYARPGGQLRDALIFRRTLNSGEALGLS